MAKYHQLMLLNFLCLIVGCHSLTGKADPEWLKDFDRTDAIMIKNGTSIMTVTDKDQVQSLRNIYSNAKWKPWRTTLPGNLDEQTITLYSDGKELRHFSYRSLTLWESTSYTENRTASLSVSQEAWLSKLFAEASENQE